MFLRRLIGNLVSLAIMPSQTYNPSQLAHLREQLFEDTHKVNLQIDSTNGARIDFCELQSHDDMQAEKAPKDQKIIIHAVGNGDFYENHLGDYAQDTRRYGCKIVGFNFRGVLGSTGKAYSEEDWIEDVIALVNHYRAQGIPPENIILNGHSLGAAILTMAAARIYQQDIAEAQKKGIARAIAKDEVKSVKLMNNRSFSTLTEEVLSLLRGVGCGLINTGVYILPMLFFLSVLNVAAIATVYLGLSFYYPKLPQAMLRPILQAVLWSVFGTMDALSAYKTLPDEAKDHIVAKDDGIIRREAGLHYGLKSVLSARKHALRAGVEQGVVPDEIIEILDARLMDLKDCKVRFAHNTNAKVSIDAHNNPLRMLYTYHKLRVRAGEQDKPRQLSGQEVMNNKIRKLMAS